jgi:hypothetical protein
MDGRTALMLDYRAVAAGEPQIDWQEDCVTISLPGRSRGRIWVEAATDDVLRLDEHLVGRFEFSVPAKQMRSGWASHVVLERADSTIRYRRVDFQDPDERLMVPASIETVTVFRGASRTRITQRFSDYRRFLTGGRLVVP